MKRRGAGTLTKADIGTKVKLQGWVQRRRSLGGLVFVDVRDRSGLCQVVVHPEDRPELAARLEPVRSEWVIEIEGTVKAREAQAVNPQMATGEIEVAGESATILAKADPLPFSLDARRKSSSAHTATAAFSSPKKTPVRTRPSCGTNSSGKASATTSAPR